MMLTSFERAIFLTATSILVFFGFFYGLGSYGLLNNNEGLYAQIPLEMLANHQYVLPTINGGPYIEKPPLLYWLTALSFKIFGISETSARLVPALSGVFLISATSLFIRKTIHERAAILSVLLFSSSIGFLIFSRMVYFDILLTLFLSLSLFSFFLWDQTSEKKWIRASYGFLALAVLTKGFLAVALAFLTAVLFLVWTRASRKKWRTFFDITGISFFLLILLPWHVAALTHEKGFAWLYFINEHVLRFLGLREPKDYYSGPLYYYIHRLLLYVMPWTILLFLAPKRISLSPLVKFLICWFGVFFVFFSFSKAKANYYVVTTFPPLICLLSLSLSEKKKWGKLALLSVSFFTLAPSVAALILASGRLTLPPKIALYAPPLSMNWIGIWLFLSFSSLPLIWKARKVLFKLLPLTLQSIPVTLLALKAISFQESAFSAKEMTQEILTQYPQATFCLYRDYEKISSVLFYVRKPMLILDSLSNDLLYAEKTRGSRAGFISPSDLKKVHGDLVFFVFKERFSEFEERFPEAINVSHKGPIRAYRVKPSL